MKKFFAFLTLCTALVGGVSFAYAEEIWKDYQSPHFTIYYKDAPKDVVKNVAESAETYYKEITDDLGFRRKNWTWKNKAKIYIFQDQEDYMKDGGNAWSHGMASVQQKVIKTFPSAHGFFDSILPHELGHIIFREFIGFRAVVPLWFEEGVAIYQEKARRWGIDSVVKKAVKQNQFIPLQELSKMRLARNSSQETVDLFYAESASAVNFMITELGKYRFEKLCKQLKEGESFEKALASYSQLRSSRNSALEQLDKLWLKHIKR